MNTEYIPVFLFLIVAIFAAATMLIASALLGPRKATRVKRMPYESGMDPIAQTHSQIDAVLHQVHRSIDQDQFANAGVLSKANGALRIAQTDFTPDRLAAEISALAAEPARLGAMAAAARAVGRLDAAERLADLVAKVAGI